MLLFKTLLLSSFSNWNIFIVKMDSMCKVVHWNISTRGWMVISADNIFKC